ncbi:hypothetical protein [Devosia sp.]|uniref:hypothetical protein n=1 Tax=Devosia sp. TaxID=1871048 RepID=UPI003A92889E
MKSDTRTIITTAAVIGGAAMLMALPSLLPPAIAKAEPMATLLSSANEILPPAIRMDDLVRWDFKSAPGVVIDDSVSTEPLGYSEVEKIGYGRSETVKIVETATGVYSSDGIYSPYVRYPGIELQPDMGAALFAIWGGAGGWTFLRSMTAGSFLSMTPFDGGNLVVTDDGTCVVTKRAVSC